MSDKQGMYLGMIEAANERKCQHITKTPLYIKSIGGIAIDRSEWKGDKGAFFRYDEKPCEYIADPGETLCPRHKLEASQHEAKRTERDSHER